MQTLRFFYRGYHWVYLSILVGFFGCQSESVVGDDCDPSKSDCIPVASSSVEPALTEKIKDIDILFVMDNSQSMEQEQDAIGNLINVLITGDRDGDGTPELEPAESLHLAVISTDMGLPGYADGYEYADPKGNCMGLGDDGLLLSEPDVYQQPSCSDRRYPRFLTYTAGVDNAEQTAQDYFCMLNIGREGCGWEMPLEATLKALWPASNDSITFLNAVGEAVATGHGEKENDGFLREDSLLAIVVVTDEDDCSIKDMDVIGPDYGERESLTMRCFDYPDKLYSIERYADNLKTFRPDREDRVLFAVIAGVPPHLVGKDSDLPQHLLGYVDKDPEKVEAYYESILNDADMEQIENKERHFLEPSCLVLDDEDNEITYAIPPRRLVELAREFGANGVVQSICDLGLGSSLETVTLAITNRMEEAAEKAEAAQ